MIKIAKSNITEREVLFGNSAKKAGITNPAIIEKIFGYALHSIGFFINHFGQTDLFSKVALA